MEELKEKEAEVGKEEHKWMAIEHSQEIKEYLTTNLPNVT